MDKILTKENLLDYSTIVPANYKKGGMYSNSKVVEVYGYAKCLKIEEGIDTIDTFAITPELLVKNNICQVSLPSTLKTIKQNAFYGCDFEIISCKAPIVKVEQSAFRLCNYLQDIDMIMDIDDNSIIDIWRPICANNYNFKIPKCLRYFKLGKMLNGKIYSRAYETCEEDILPTEIRTKNEYGIWEYPNTIRHFISVEENE